MVVIFLVNSLLVTGSRHRYQEADHTATLQADISDTSRQRGLSRKRVTQSTSAVRRLHHHHAGRQRGLSRKRVSVDKCRPTITSHWSSVRRTVHEASFSRQVQTDDDYIPLECFKLALIESKSNLTAVTAGRSDVIRKTVADAETLTVANDLSWTVSTLQGRFRGCCGC